MYMYDIQQINTRGGGHDNKQRQLQTNIQGTASSQDTQSANLCDTYGAANALNTYTTRNILIYAKRPQGLSNIRNGTPATNSFECPGCVYIYIYVNTHYENICARHVYIGIYMHVYMYI